MFVALLPRDLEAVQRASSDRDQFGGAAGSMKGLSMRSGYMRKTRRLLGLGRERCQFGASEPLALSPAGRRNDFDVPPGGEFPDRTR